jgi:HTH-type transcriptional repressor of NAD biosynthesis genes
MSHGLVVGKFYPPHAGHHYLIDTAVAECDDVTVVVCDSGPETYPARQRGRWIQDRHPSVRVLLCFDDTPVAYTDETWGYFLDALMQALDDSLLSPYGNGNKPYPDVVYSGEDYAQEFAERLTHRYDQRIARHAFPERVTARVVDRLELPISGTQCRNDLRSMWNYLASATRADLCKRVVVCGAESTGTTTLAKALAEHYQTVCVPEYGRHFDWAVGKHHEWTHEDFLHIAGEQRRWEDNLARLSGPVLICDTDEYATAMFHEVYLGEAAPGIRPPQPADLYIVTDHGIPFEDDGTRFNSGRRGWMTGWLGEHLPRPRLVSGSREQRLERATRMIDPLLHWDFADPVEYAQAQQ